MQTFLTTPLPSYVYPLLGIGIVALFALRGFFRGVFHELFNLISLGAAYVLASPFGIVLRPILPLDGIPAFLQDAAAGIVGGAIAYILVLFEFWMITRLFKLRRPWEGRAKVLIRCGGVLLGAAFGVAIVLLISWFVLLMGKLTGGIPGLSAGTAESVLMDEETHQGEGGEKSAATESSAAKSWLTLPARMVSAHEQALKESALGQIAEETNPVPQEVDDGLGIAGEILRDPAKMKILMEYEPMTKILQQEMVAKLMSNAEIQRMVKEGNILGVVNHPSMQALFQDPALRQSMQTIDLEELLRRLKTP